MLQLKPKSPLLILSLLITLSSYSQVVWNENSLKVSKDIGILEDMTGSTPVSFYQYGTFFSSKLISPAGFTFQYGLNNYNGFYISPKGFIKFGNAITGSNPALDTNVLVPLRSGAEWNVNYKTFGTGNTFKLILEFKGDMQPTGQPVRFQVWLFPAGKIQFLYEQINGYYGWENIWNYKIFCQANIMGSNVIASLLTKPGNANPAIVYSKNIIQESHDTIYGNTRLTFQPDTIKPLKPSGLSFTNVFPGCFGVSFTEASANESVIVLERADSGLKYQTEKIIYTNSPGGSTQYLVQQNGTQPLSFYNYRLYTSNGFKNSDTIYSSLQTPMPQLSGIKRIPGDYPTITALLDDATCKHIGPNLVIELQTNYSFASETLPLHFKKQLQNPLIQSIIIRPAANASLAMEANFSGSMIFVDSVKHVVFDGRAGGSGTKRDLTIRQLNKYYATIQYGNGADSGGVNYCNIIKTSTSDQVTAAVVVTSYGINNQLGKKSVESFQLTNNNITADANTAYSLVYIESVIAGTAKNILIDNNYFNSYSYNAITLNGLDEGAVISNNHFFQPKPFVGIKGGSCIATYNTAKVKIDNNYIGGNSGSWGTGKYTLSETELYAFIRCSNESKNNQVIISNNKFGNIQSLNSYYNLPPSLLKVDNSNVIIKGNRFGTNDSINSITWAGFMEAVVVGASSGIIADNFFSGLQADYLQEEQSNESTIISVAASDSILIANNDIGGSDNVLANSSFDQMVVFSFSCNNSKVEISNNKLRGFSSRYGNIKALNVSGNLYKNNQFKIERNDIHHIQSAGDVSGIYCRLSNFGTANIHGNNIYALQTKALLGQTSTIGSIYGISYIDYSNGTESGSDTGKVVISANKIHSFETIRLTTEALYSFNAINVAAAESKIFNNEIRLGINSSGNPIDYSTSVSAIFISPVEFASHNNDRYFIEHNSIFFGSALLDASFITSYYDNQQLFDSIYVNMRNNIIYTETVGYLLSYLPGIISSATNNLWYSGNLTALISRLSEFEMDCHCTGSDIIGNPFFSNPYGNSDNFSLRLASGSKADSAGAQSLIGVEEDMLGLNRAAYSPVDIGCYAATPTVNYSIYWSGALNSAWENPANWIGGKLPDVNTDVIIDSGLTNYPIINSNATCRSLTLKPGGSVKILSGHSLNVLH